MTNKEHSKYLRFAESSLDNEELAECYNRWADTYDKDVLQFGYFRVPAVMCGLIGRFVPPGEGPILDAGAGTGILGEVLHLLGYRNVTGIDISTGMLEIAHKKGVYRRLQQMEIGKSMRFPDKTFDAVLSMGVFTAGCHMTPDVFEEFIRITKPAGCIILSIRTEIDEYPAFKKEMAELEEKGRWRRKEMTPSCRSLPVENSKAMIEIPVFQIP